MRKIALILAGGKGTRLWPLSRENHPKQFVEFKGGLSLFQLTLVRLLSVFQPQDIFIISHDNYKFTLVNQIELLTALPLAAKISLKKNILFEPAPKSTLPAILLAIKYIETHRPLLDDDLVYVFPSDHMIEPQRAFTRCMMQGASLAQKGKIVVFGLAPTLPKEGYGYITVKKKFGAGYLVDRFIEKPTAKKAAGLIRKGAFWNAGIFCFSKKVFLEELKRHEPGLHALRSLALDLFLRGFKGVAANSIDYGIMQKTRDAALVKFAVHWTDLGSWDSFLQYDPRHRRGNVAVGKAEFLESSGCFSYAKDRLVCMVGLNDVIAVDASDALLLVKKGSSDKVRALVTLIGKKGYTHTKDSSTVYRPWGYYTVLHQGSGYKVKEIGIYPKRSLSLQKHKFRSEHWNVVEGRVYVQVDGSQKLARKNQSVYVPRGKKHRLLNLENKIAKIIEVQIGPYLGEDDITRLSHY